ncbi:MAG: hypothetical protein CL774_03040 [Chloroflexi bacterium]|nr:hypothetical protein [Chloroflexota bacterium]|tara:strand:+ start:4911 stop:5465 length:555 start_codon:yes stop_codon:yes gene_type:complete
MKNVKILWDNDAIEKKIKEMAKNITTKWENEPVVNLIPVITGGMIFATKLIMDLEKFIPEKWVVNPVIASAYEYSYNPNKPEVVRVSDYENKFKEGSPSIIIDDLLDTGITLSIVKNMIRAITNDNVEVAVLVDKVAKRKIDIEPEYHGFTIKNDYWLVGYGMDDKGLLRGMDSIGYIEQIKML